MHVRLAAQIRDLYRPLEQQMGEFGKSLETSIDIFPLGILLVELMHTPANQNGKESGNDKEFWNILTKLISGITKDKKFPSDFHSDQFINQLILEMTDKDVKKRPTVGKILEVFDTSLRRNVTGWARHSPEFESSLQAGDVIEFNRVPCSHWGLYYGDGKMVQFHPASATDEGKGNSANFEKIVPAQISLVSLKEVAGVCLIRMNNRPEIRAKIRLPISTMEILKILLERPEPQVFKYCIAYFNSEHFVTYLKFAGVSFSSQVMSNTKVFGQVKMHLKKSPEDVQYFNRLAYEQWMENSKRGSHPQDILEKGIRDWAEGAVKK